MEAVTPKIPMTLLERNEAPDVIRVPATWEEYLELAEIVPYNIEYLFGELISMSQATDLHEQLIAQIITLFTNLLDDQPDYRVLGSNVKICIEEGKAEFNADLSVIKGPSDYVVLPSGRVSTARIRNPEIVVEISQEEIFARAYSRTEQPTQWIDTDYRSIDDTIRLGQLALPLRSIYRKTPLAV